MVPYAWGIGKNTEFQCLPLDISRAQVLRKRSAFLFNSIQT